MAHVRFSVDPDLLPLLESYRAQHMPNAGISDVAAELVRIALASTPEAGVRASIAAEVHREHERWFHGKLQGVLRDLRDESIRVVGEMQGKDRDG